MKRARVLCRLLKSRSTASCRASALHPLETLLRAPGPTSGPWVSARLRSVPSFGRGPIMAWDRSNGSRTTSMRRPRTRRRTTQPSVRSTTDVITPGRACACHSRTREVAPFSRRNQHRECSGSSTVDTEISRSSAERACRPCAAGRSGESHYQRAGASDRPGVDYDLLAMGRRAHLVRRRHAVQGHRRHVRARGKHVTNQQVHGM